jgi:hypothetical protein
VDDLKTETNETKISKAIASILKQKQPETQNPKLKLHHEQNHKNHINRYSKKQN